MKENLTKIREMIEQTIASYLDEAGYRDRIAAAASATSTDKVDVNKLMAGLQALKQKGATGVSLPQLMDFAKKSLVVAAPLGAGQGQALVNQATSKTGGAPVMAPPSNLFAREGKLTLSKADLKEMVNRAVAKKIHETMGVGNPIMAKREIIALMDDTSRSFENEIVRTFKLQNPDMLSSELQRYYLEVVEEMKSKLVAAAMDAVEKLIKLPKQDEGNGNLKS